MSKPHTYIAEIDGLRAVAVLAVLLFHAFPDQWSGGFIGVDVFFVISGFVISRTYLRRLSTRQTSLRHFYVKRIRRLAPAYALVLAVSSLFALLLLEPKSLRNFGESLIAQPFYAQNITFWLEGEYFDRAHTKPLLHTWSLAVEEQFYLLFGILILVARRSARVLIPSLVALSIVSLAAGHLISEISPKTSFYLVPTRIWEFGIGIFAYYCAARLPDAPGNRRTDAACVAATIALLCSIVLFDEESRFPGAQAMLASAAVFVLLILFERRPSDTYKPFGWRPVRYMGEVSYSLYLWHWPVIVFLIAALDRSLHWYEASGALALSFLLAMLTYRYVENPIRFKKRAGETRQLLTGWVLGSVAVLGIGVGLVQTDGAVFRYPEPERTWLRAAQEQSPYRCPRVFRVMNPGRELCKINEESGAPGVLIIGDSHADQLDEMIAAIGEQHGVPVFLAVRACAIDRFDTTSHCSESVLRRLIEDARAAGVRTVIGTSFWGDSGLSYEGFRAGVEALVDAGMSVHLSEVVPHGDYFDPGNRALASLGKHATIREPYTTAQYEADVALQRSIFDRLQAEFPGQVSIIRPARYLCDSLSCEFDTDGYPNYFDSNHLTKTGANRLRPMYARVFERLSGQAAGVSGGASE